MTVGDTAVTTRAAPSPTTATANNVIAETPAFCHREGMRNAIQAAAAIASPVIASHSSNAAGGDTEPKKLRSKKRPALVRSSSALNRYAELQSIAAIRKYRLLSEGARRSVLLRRSARNEVTTTHSHTAIAMASTVEKA